MNRTFQPPRGSLRGTVMVPGDKSLSHRAVLFAAMAEGTSRLTGVLDSADVRSTIGAVRALGARVDLAPDPTGALSGTVTGWGNAGPVQPAAPIDCGNSGTTARLLMGVLAGWPITVTLTGDESLSRRPMRRVTEPLARMGVEFETSAEGTLPVIVRGSAELSALAYESPVASAQVKTAVLLAGLRARGGASVTEPALSRDHTELLLPAFGVAVTVDPSGVRASLCGPQSLKAVDVDVPRDPSSAAFVASAALLVPGSEVVIPGVSLNPTRVGFLRVYERMGAEVRVTEEPSAGNERVGTIAVRFSEGLAGTLITAEEVPALVDEVPVMALVAARASGTTRFEGIGELRVKESDRLEAVFEGLTALGVTARAGSDWLEVDGPSAVRGALLDSRGDHRLAMTWALAGLVARDPVEVERFEAIDVSYPGFARDLARLGS